VRDVLAALKPWAILAGGVLIVAALYLAKALLVPVMLAVLLTILLDPVASFLQRLVGRTASILLVVLVAFSVIGLLVWGLSTQIASLANELPRYRLNAVKRIQEIRGASRGGTLEKVGEAVKDIQREIEAPDGDAPPKRPVPVVQAETAPDRWGFPAGFAAVLQWLGSAGLVLVLVIFMLFEREEMRNRLIRLAGQRRLTATTKALDEAGRRISRYLAMQSLINGIFGIGIGVGLFLIGVPYALVWAFLAATLRFIPYVGPWAAALAPIAISLVAFDDWTRPALVAALFVVFELFSNIVLETILYADVAGVSQVGLLVAVAFWTWLWGPAGLLMATPLTVCLVVFGKHVPSLGFVVTLLGDTPALAPDVTYYQRLLAGDQHEAMEIVESALRTRPREQVLDEIMLPALNQLREDVEAGRVSDEDHARVLDGTREIVEDLAATPAEREGPEPGVGVVALLGYPAGDEIDEMALRIFGQTLDPALFSLEIVSGRMLPGEVVAHVQRRGPPLVCIATLPPAPSARARYLVKKLRAAVTDVKIIVARWGPGGAAGDDDTRLTAAGADGVGHALTESRTQLYQLLSVVPRAPADRETAAAQSRSRTG
jgi:predicted PurR-regulated permease PerM